MNYLSYADHIGADDFIKTWCKTTLKNYVEKSNPSTEEVEHILDYLVQSKKRVTRMSYAEAKKLSDAWMKTQIKKGNAIEENPEDTSISENTTKKRAGRGARYTRESSLVGGSWTGRWRRLRKS